MFDTENLVTDLLGWATTFLGELAPVFMLIGGILLGFWVIDILLGVGEETISAGGKNMTWEDVNSTMDLDWYHSLSHEDQVRISEFDHRGARKRMKL